MEKEKSNLKGLLIRVLFLFLLFFTFYAHSAKAVMLLDQTTIGVQNGYSTSPHLFFDTKGVQNITNIKINLFSTTGFSSNNIDFLCYTNSTSTMSIIATTTFSFNRAANVAYLWDYTPTTPIDVSSCTAIDIKKSNISGSSGYCYIQYPNYYLATFNSTNFPTESRFAYVKNSTSTDDMWVYDPAVSSFSGTIKATSTPPACPSCPDVTVYPNNYPVELNQAQDISVDVSKNYTYAGTSTIPIGTTYTYTYSAWRQFIWIVILISSVLFLLTVFLFLYKRDEKIKRR